MAVVVVVVVAAAAASPVAVASLTVETAQEKAKTYRLLYQLSPEMKTAVGGEVGSGGDGSLVVDVCWLLNVPAGDESAQTILSAATLR